MIISFGKKLCDVCCGAVRQREKRREERGSEGRHACLLWEEAGPSFYTLLMKGMGKGRKSETQREVEYLGTLELKHRSQ